MYNHILPKHIGRLQVLEDSKYTISVYFRYNSVIFYAAAVRFEKILPRDLDENWWKSPYWSKEQ